MNKPTCRAMSQATKEACGKPATHVVTFGDGDKAFMCEGCSLQTEQLAASHGTRVSTSKLEAAPAVE